MQMRQPPGPNNWPQQTDREQTDHEQTNCEQRRLAEKGDSKNILLSPEPSCPNPHFVTKLVWRNQHEITVMKPLVCSQFVRGQLTWLNTHLEKKIASGCYIL